MSPFTTLRSWLRHLSNSDRLVVARRDVALKFEVAAIAKRLDGAKAVVFPSPGGHAMPIVSGFVGHRRWMAEALGVPLDALHSTFRRAAERPLPWREVPTGDAPCQRQVHRNADIRALLPIPFHNEHDAGPYITAGLVIARNPHTGIQNGSINRIQVNAPDRMATLLLPRHLHAFYRAAEQKGESLPVAVVIGVDPATLLALAGDCKH